MYASNLVFIEVHDNTRICRLRNWWQLTFVHCSRNRSAQSRNRIVESETCAGKREDRCRTGSSPPGSLHPRRNRYLAAGTWPCWLAGQVRQPWTTFFENVNTLLVPDVIIQAMPHPRSMDDGRWMRCSRGSSLDSGGNKSTSSLHQDGDAPRIASPMGAFHVQSRRKDVVLCFTNLALARPRWASYVNNVVPVPGLLLCSLHVRRCLNSAWYDACPSRAQPMHKGSSVP